MTTIDEPLMRIDDFPADVPCVPALIDAVTNLADEPGDWSVTIHRRGRAQIIGGVAPEWDVTVEADTYEKGRFAAGVIRADRSVRRPGSERAMWRGYQEGDDGAPYSVYVHAPKPPVRQDDLAVKLCELVDQAELADRHRDAEIMRVALEQLRRGEAA